MEKINPVVRFRHWWAAHVPPVEPPSRRRFYVWLPFFIASGAAFLQRWTSAGIVLMTLANIALLYGLSPNRVRPATKLTLREFFVVAAIIFGLAFLVYLALVTPLRLPSIPPTAFRIVVVIIWVAEVIRMWRRVFAPSAVKSA